MAFPFLRDKIAGTKNFRAIAVEPKSCSTLLTGKYEYDLGDVAGMTPYLKMYTLGHDFIRQEFMPVVYDTMVWLLW